MFGASERASAAAKLNVRQTYSAIRMTTVLRAGNEMLTKNTTRNAKKRRAISGVKKRRMDIREDATIRIVRIYE